MKLNHLMQSKFLGGNKQELGNTSKKKIEQSTSKDKEMKQSRTSLPHHVLHQNIKLMNKPEEKRPISKPQSKEKEKPQSEEKTIKLIGIQSSKIDKSLNIKKLAKVTQEACKKKTITPIYKSKEVRKISLAKPGHKDKYNDELIRDFSNKPKGYKTKAQFLLKKKVKFKKNKNDSDNDSISKSKSNSKSKTQSTTKEESNTKKQRAKSSSLSKGKSTPKKKEPIHKIRKKHSEIKERINMLLNADINDIIAESKANKLASSSSPAKEVNKQNRKNFVKMNLKKGYKEKKRLRPLNIRRHKIGKCRQFTKFQKNLIEKSKVDTYLGKGGEGLEDIDTLNDDIKAELTHQADMNFLKELNEKMPVFSQGFIANEHLPKTANKQDITPVKALTNRLTTALKSSLRKCVPFDTELKFLSKEFRYLLSDKKEEIEKLNLLKTEVNEKKKLEFNQHSQSPLPFFQSQHPQNSSPNMDVINEEAHGLSEEEVASLENDILLKVLEENFGFKTFYEGQLPTIKSILNNKRTLTVIPPCSGKSLCYQLASLVLDGLTIVISPLLASINNHLVSLPQIICGASLTSYTTHRQRDEILSAIKEKKIKILFITPERFSMESFTDIGEISLICFEEASSACPLSINYRSSYVSCDNTINRLKPSSFLLLSNSAGYTIQEYLIKTYQINNLITVPIVIPTYLHISISKDEKKLIALLKLLRSNQFRQIGQTIIFCNTQKTVNQVTSYLNQNGLNANSYHSGKEELERQIVSNNFMKNKIKLLVCTTSFSSSLNKKGIKLLIGFDIPNSIEQLIQSIGLGIEDKDTYCHFFLNDDDYFLQRKMILCDVIDKTKILKFIHYLYNQAIPSIKTSRLGKRNYDEANNSLTLSPKRSKVIKENDGTTIISLNFTQVYEHSDIKKQAQLYLLTSLINNSSLNDISSITIDNNLSQETHQTKMKLLGIGPCQISIRFYKTQPEELRLTQNIINTILDNSKSREGCYTFNTMDICSIHRISFTELINYLFSMQGKGEISYEAKDEGAFIIIEKIPSSYKEILSYFTDLNKKHIDLNIRKLNCSYIILRKYAATSVDTFINNSYPIKCLSSFQSFHEYNEEIKRKIVSYFNHIKEETIDIEMAGNELEKKILLPIYIIETQREQTAVVKDIEELTIKEFENNNSVNIVDLINILFGIVIKSKEMKSYFSHPLWGKFVNYDYDDLTEIVKNALEKVKMNHANRLDASSSRKKLKLV